MNPPILALSWYTSLPDAPVSAPEKPPGATELSRRLTQMLGAREYCDMGLRAAGEAWSEDIGAHRVVLNRNHSLKLQSLEACASPLRITVPKGVRTETLRAVVVAHYCEVESDTALAGPLALLRKLRAEVPAEEWESVESIFGSLADDLAWDPLRVAVASDLFADCSLAIQGGVQVRAHRVLVAGVDDGDFFSGALRWPGMDGVVSMPEGLSHEALLILKRVRYGTPAYDAERILELRHFAELLGWSAAREHFEVALEILLADASAMDSESLLAVFEHAEESVAMPPRLKAAALAAAVRQWSRVVDAAEHELPKRRRNELAALSRIRNRDGHICGSLEEYLHAAEDDLMEWERSLGLEATMVARKQVEAAWIHWQQILFEYGHIFGAALAETWRAKVVAQRELLREVRSRDKGMQLCLPGGRVWFEPTHDWREVPANAICPSGLEYRFDMQTGKNFARLC